MSSKKQNNMEVIFSGYGIELLKRDGRFYISYDAGHINIMYVEEEISEQEMIDAQKGGEHVDRVIRACQQRAESQGRKWWEHNE